MKARFGMAIMLITHAMGVVAETAQRVVVMYAGKVIEEAPVDAAVRQPAPSLHAGPDPLDPAHRHGGDPQDAARGDPGRGAEPAQAAARLPLRGALPLRDAANAARRCRRCIDVGGGHKVACVLVQDELVRRAMTEPLLRVKGLTKNFAIGGGFLGAQRRDRACGRHVSFEIGPGETLGLVGESGSGKSTTGRCILRLIEPTAGEVWFEGRNVTALDAADVPRALPRHADHLPGPVRLARTRA